MMDLESLLAVKLAGGGGGGSGGLQMDLLWENASPNSVFPKQLIACTPFEYKAIMIYAKKSTGYDAPKSYLFEMIEATNVDYIGTLNDISENVFNFASFARNAQFNKENTGIYFNDAYTALLNTSNSPSSITTAMIPYKIYGIKY